MLNFQCTKATAKETPGSLWTSGPMAVIDIDPDEIEMLFKKPVLKKKGPPKPKKPAPVSVIDPKRSNNCGIALSRIKVQNPAPAHCSVMRIGPRCRCQADSLGFRECF